MEPGLIINTKKCIKNHVYNNKIYNFFGDIQRWLIKIRQIKWEEQIIHTKNCAKEQMMIDNYHGFW